MKKIIIQLLISNFLLTTLLFSQQSFSSDFFLVVTKKYGVNLQRTGSFLPTLQEPTKKNIDPFDPGASAHFTVLLKDELTIKGKNDSIENKLHTPGSFIYIFENTDRLDSARFLPMVSDSTTVDHFLEAIKKVRRREWELYRIIIQPRYANRNSQNTWTFYLRFQPSLCSVNIPNKNNRQNFQIKSISPVIPVVHIGNYDSAHYTIGAGFSFNFGLLPRRPLVRLCTDLLGPVSIEWMFRPPTGIHDIFALHTSAIGLFFNSGYGIFHWGIAFYTATYSRAEAYFGINLVPVMSLWESRHKQRYHW
jgi:hypothetical protein